MSMSEAQISASIAPTQRTGMATRAKSAVLMVVSGSAAAQLVTLLSSLFIARIYLPEAYGTFAVVSSLVAVIGTVASLRLESAIPIPESEDVAKQLLGSTFTSAATVAVVWFALALAFGTPVSVAMGLDPSARVLLMLAPLSIFLIGCYNGLIQYNLRQRRYKVTAVRPLTQAVTTALFQILAGLISPTPVSLLLGLTLGLLASIIVLSYDLRGWRPSGFRTTAALIKQFKEFALLLTPTTLINALGLQIPLILGGVLFGAKFTGWFGITYRFLAVPITVIGHSIGQVCLGEFSTLVRMDRKRLKRAFLQASGLLLLAGLAVGSVVAIWGPSIFGLFLGETYLPAGYFARALSIGLVFEMLATPLASLLILLKKPRWQAGWDVTRLVAVALAMVIPASLGVDALQTLIVLGATQGVLYLGMWLLTFRLVSASHRATHEATLVEGPDEQDHPTG